MSWRKPAITRKCWLRQILFRFSCTMPTGARHALTRTDEGKYKVKALDAAYTAEELADLRYQ